MPVRKRGRFKKTVVDVCIEYVYFQIYFLGGDNGIIDNIVTCFLLINIPVSRMKSF